MAYRVEKYKYNMKNVSDFSLIMVGSFNPGCSFKLSSIIALAILFPENLEAGLVVS